MPIVKLGNGFIEIPEEAMEHVEAIKSVWQYELDKFMGKLSDTKSNNTEKPG